MTLSQHRGGEGRAPEESGNEEGPSCLVSEIESRTHRSTQTVASDGFTSQTDSTQKTSCQQSSNSISLFRTRQR